MAQTNLIIYITDWCSDCRRALRFLDARSIPYHAINIDYDPAADVLVRQINHGYRSVPTLIWADGSTLTEPTTAMLREKFSATGSTGPPSPA